MIDSIKLQKTGRVTLQDVAERAGVGVATVDRVLNKRAPVSERTSERVLNAADALGYYARGLIRQRLEEKNHSKRLGFILQKESKQFYRALAQAIRNLTTGMENRSSTVQISFVGSLAPDSLAEEIARMRNTVDAIAAVSIDHPIVSAEVAKCARDGIPFFSLLSPISSPEVSGYIGIDSRKAGRTAGWAMKRMALNSGEFGILVGSHRYLGHEALEGGFRSYMREYAPAAKIHESLVFLDDAAVAYEAATEILARHPDLCGLYQCGGGARGTVKALKESGRAGTIVFICHELTDTTTKALLDGTVDLAIATPIDAVAKTSIGAMENALRSPRILTSITPLQAQIVTPENV